MEKANKKNVMLKSIVRGLLLLAVLAFSTSIYAQECNIIYVTPNGGSSGSVGTKANPASFLHALAIANSSNNKIYMAAGTYVVSNEINMPSNIIIEGGFDADWNKSNGAATTIFRDNTNPLTTPSRLVGVNCVNASNFRMQDLTIRVANAVGNGTSTYGVYLSGSSNYQMVRCKVIAGNGGNGNNGASGTNGLVGANGVDGEEGDEDGPCCRLGGAGGSGSFPGSNAGGIGGDGGERGTYEEWSTDGEAFPGYPGQDGEGVGGGFGGGGGIEIFTTIISIQCDRTPVTDGQIGADGADGLNGAPGIAGAYSFASGYFQPGTGTAGTVGTHGAGGGGGGGGGSQGGLFYETIFNLIENTNGSGAGGGGGGEGGQSGTGGLGGTGGGGSFGIFVYNNGANGLIRDCQFQAGLAGLGGLGGSGGAGGDGGSGGLGGGYQTNCDVGAGGHGGEGGRGGTGGMGGRGSNGVTHDYYEWQGGIPVTQMNVNSLSQPVVKVQYSGCTNTPVYFSTDATGTVDWYFGAGSTPTTSSGTSAVCAYTTQGRKTFTMVVNGIAYTFSDFIDIFRNGVNAHPEIVSVDDSLCIGDMGTYASSVTADSYIWELTSETDTISVAGPTYHDLADMPFDTSGNFTLTLTTWTNCCGVSFPTSFDIFIDSLILPGISIESNFTDSSNTICDNETVTFSASADDVGPHPVFQWQVNGSNAGSNSSTFSTATLNDGDQISCIVTSSLLCASGMKDTSNVITVHVIDIPVVTCMADSFITHEPTYFDAEVTSGGLPPYDYYWDFGDNTQGFGNSVAHLYTVDGTYEANVEVIDSNGCASSCSTIVTVSSALSVGYTTNTVIGCAPVDIYFNNNSSNAITFFWNFGDGHFSTDRSPTHTYDVPGTYDVSLWGFNGETNDSMTVQSQIVIYPTPTANFQGYPLNIVVAGGDTVFFADNSVNADSWYWDFGDPSSGSDNNSNLQNPSHVYNTNGTYDVTLVVENVHGCADTLTNRAFVVMNVGIDEITGIKAFKILNVYPVPLQDVFKLDLYVPSTDHLEITIADINGKTLGGLFNGDMPAGEQTIELNATEFNLSSGVYLLKVNYKESNLYKILLINSNSR